uniref:Uncharacterized protein n=1 Tax=Glossina pallidipes TaxID=7398 RepID=A0A1B0ACJ8_GLOPL
MEWLELRGETSYVQLIYINSEPWSTYSEIQFASKISSDNGKYNCIVFDLPANVLTTTVDIFHIFSSNNKYDKEYSGKIASIKEAMILYSRPYTDCLERTVGNLFLPTRDIHEDFTKLSGNIAELKRYLHYTGVIVEVVIAHEDDSEIPLPLQIRQ